MDLLLIEWRLWLLSNTSHDKEIERKRYDQRAAVSMISLNSCNDAILGANALPSWLRSPYIAYELEIRKMLSSIHIALEIGAGTGQFSSSLLRWADRVIATDISSKSLDLLQLRYPKAKNLETRVCDMESLDFMENTFDLVASAGSLSYGDSDLVMNEIYRVLKPGGYFICVDSLNHNPIYRLNRAINCLRGRRTASTLKRMPTFALIDSYRKLFGRVEIQYFGAFSWLSPLMASFIGEAKTAEWSDTIDRRLKVKMSAFKFVMVVQKPGCEVSELMG
jgi:ubiquinone/menaquinone biosynthesis C-methylase UbiE